MEGNPMDQKERLQAEKYRQLFDNIEITRQDPISKGDFTVKAALELAKMKAAIFITKILTYSMMGVLIVALFLGAVPKNWELGSARVVIKDVGQYLAPFLALAFGFFFGAREGPSEWDSGG